MASFTNKETEAHEGEKLSQGPQCTGPGAQMGAQGTRPGPSTEQLLRWQLSGGLSWGPETLLKGASPYQLGLLLRLWAQAPHWTQVCVWARHVEAMPSDWCSNGEVLGL